MPADTHNGGALGCLADAELAAAFQHSSMRSGAVATACEGEALEDPLLAGQLRWLLGLPPWWRQLLPACCRRCRCRGREFDSRGGRTFDFEGGVWVIVTL